MQLKSQPAADCTAQEVLWHCNVQATISILERALLMFSTDMATAFEWEKCKLSACCSIDGTACSMYLANVTAEGYCLRIEENSMPMPHLQL